MTPSTDYAIPRASLAPPAAYEVQALTLEEADQVGGGNPIAAFLIGAAIGYVAMRYL